jgi:hypothetical protein
MPWAMKIPRSISVASELMALMRSRPASAMCLVLLDATDARADTLDDAHCAMTRLMRNEFRL